MARTNAVVLFTSVLLVASTCMADSPTVERGAHCGEVKVWQAATGECRLTLQTTSEEWAAVCVAISPDGQRLAGGMANGDVWLWDLASGRKLQHVLAKSPHAGEPPPPVIRGLSFSADGQSVLVVNFDSLRRWDGRASQLVPIHQRAVTARDSWLLNRTVAFDARGRWVVLVKPPPEPHAACRVLEVRDTTSGKELDSFSFEGDIRQAAFSRDGEKLAVAGFDSGTVVVELWQRSPKKSLGRTPGVGPVAFSPDGKTLAFSDPHKVEAWKSNELVLWDIASGELRRAPRQFISCLACSPDGKLLATSEGRQHDEHTIQLRDARTGAIKAELSGHEGRISDLVFSPDSQLLISAGARRKAPDRVVYPSRLNGGGKRSSSIWWFLGPLAAGVLLATLGCWLYLRRTANGPLRSTRSPR